LNVVCVFRLLTRRVPSIADKAKAVDCSASASEDAYCDLAIFANHTLAVDRYASRPEHLVGSCTRNWIPATYANIGYKGSRVHENLQDSYDPSARAAQTLCTSIVTACPRTTIGAPGATTHRCNPVNDMGSLGVESDQVFARLAHSAEVTAAAAAERAKPRFGICGSCYYEKRANGRGKGGTGCKGTNVHVIPPFAVK
jgi:hypothetical protein